jgi:phospholipid/cholesterol/gamma-HCH transport system substrate-binding protein
VALPGALRQANTTFHNLRPTLDDLDPFVAAAKTGTKNLPTLLRNLKPVVTRSIPVFKDLNRAVNLKGKNNDLADAFGKLPAVESAAARSVGPTVQALNDSLPTLGFLRPYTPDLLATISNLGKITGYYDADGHYARVEPAGLGIFGLTGSLLSPALTPAQILQDLGAFGGADFNVFRRCPGGATQPALDLSNPFVGGGSGLSSPTDCNASDLPPGP